MAQRREPGLRRGVGLGLLAAVLFTNLAAGAFISLGVVAREALALTPLVFAVTGLSFLLMLVAYIEAITMLPQAGGAAGFARRAFGEVVSFFTAWALMLDYIILLAIAAMFSVHYVGSVPGLEVLLAEPWDGVASAAVIIGVGLVAARGVRTGAALAIGVSLVALVAQALLALIGLAVLFEPARLTASVDLGTTPSWAALAFALPVAMVGYVGLDSVANLGGELERPGRDVPRPMIWTAIVSVALFVSLSLLALSAAPVSVSGSGDAARTALGSTDGWIERPLVGIVAAFGLGGAPEAILTAGIALLAAAVLFLAASAALAGLARLSYFMSLHRQAPSGLARIDRGSGVPRRAVAVAVLLALGLLALSSSLDSPSIVLAQLYAFGSTFAAIVVSAAVLRLRVSDPDLERPFRAPFTVRVRGRQVPLSVVGALLAASALWILVIATHDAARVLGLIWLTVGFVVFATYRLTHGMSLAELAAPHAAPELAMDVRPYRRLLLAVRPEAGLLYGAGDAELTALAHKLLDEDVGQVAVMLVHELPLTEPLDAPLGDREAATARRLTMLRSVADELGMRLSSSVTRARAAGRAICQEAQRRDSDAVVLAMRSHRRHNDVLFGRCIAYVMRHAPCDVIVLSLPEESLTRRPVE